MKQGSMILVCLRITLRLKAACDKFILVGHKTNKGGKGEGQPGKSEEVDLKGNANKHKLKAWEDGKTYNAPLWIGYRFGNAVERIGYSHKMVHHYTQNWTHRNGFLGMPFGYQNFYLNYTEFKEGFYYDFGYYNKYSFWER